MPSSKRERLGWSRCQFRTRRSLAQLAAFHCPGSGSRRASSQGLQCRPAEAENSRQFGAPDGLRHSRASPSRPLPKPCAPHARPAPWQLPGRAGAMVLNSYAVVELQCNMRGLRPHSPCAQPQLSRLRSSSRSSREASSFVFVQRYMPPNAMTETDSDPKLVLLSIHNTRLEMFNCSLELSVSQCRKLPDRWTTESPQHKYSEIPPCSATPVSHASAL